MEHHINAGKAIKHIKIEKNKEKWTKPNQR